MENFAYNNVDYLELKSVSFGYNDNEVLHDVSMRLEKGWSICNYWTIWIRENDYY